MRRFLVGSILVCTALAVTAPLSAQVEGPGFCDLIGTALGDDAEAQCIEQGGGQLDEAVKPLTEQLCTLGDEIATGFEEGGAPAELTEPARQFLSDAGCAVGAAEIEEEPTTTAPTDETTTTLAFEDTTTTAPFQYTSTTAAPAVLGTQATSGDLPATGAAFAVGGGIALLALAVLTRWLGRASEG